MSIMKNAFAKIAGGAAVLAATIGAAHAELPAVIGTEFAKVQANGLALADLVWPILLALFGAVLLMKLAKRFGSKV